MKLLAFLIVILSFPASAGPVLLFIAGDSGERFVVTRPGVTVGVNAWVFAPVDHINGVDWQLSAPGFALASTVRTAWSPFADPIVNSPTLTSDLGATVNGDAAGKGVWPLMRLTLTAPSVPGIYTLLPTAAPGTGWVDQTFQDREFKSFGGMTVQVSAAVPAVAVPEPSYLALALIAGVPLCRRSRCSANVARM